MGMPADQALRDGVLGEPGAAQRRAIARAFALLDAPHAPCGQRSIALRSVQRILRSAIL
jgi:hypothetical protein